MTNLEYTVTENIDDVEELDEGRFQSYKGYKIKAQDPYGFFYITTPSGPLPGPMQGAFTNMETARRQIDLYLEQRVLNNQNKINNAHREKLGLKPVDPKDSN